MMLAVPAAPDPDPESAADPWADRRAGERRPVVAGTRFEVRRSDCEPDLAVALLDVSQTGLKVAVRERLSVGDRVVVWIIPPSRGWVYRGQAVVCWWTDGAEETGLAGLEFRTPLPAQSVADMAELDTR
jgi:PilZ domain